MLAVISLQRVETLEDYPKLRSCECWFVGNKGLTFTFEPFVSLHWRSLVNAAEASGEGHSEAVKENLLGLVRLGNAA